VSGFERQLALEQRADAEEADDSAGKLALARALGGSQDNTAPRIMSQRLQDQLRRRYSPVHVAARVAQLDELLAPARLHHAAAQQALAQLATQRPAHLWLPPALAQAWADAHRHTLSGLATLLARADAVRAGFAGLPVDGALPATLPEPVAVAV
jgi:MoxR-like ATPase